MAQSRYREVRIHLFSDHGMTDTLAVSRMKIDFEKAGFTFPRDYAAVWDSTMARFWFPGGDAIREQICDWLRQRPEGRILTREELEHGAAISPTIDMAKSFYLLHNGTIFAPSFMNRGSVPGDARLRPARAGQPRLLAHHASHPGQTETDPRDFPRDEGSRGTAVRGCRAARRRRASMTRKPFLTGAAVVLFCAVQCRWLLSAWVYSPFDHLGWVVFGMWLCPMAFGLFSSKPPRPAEWLLITAAACSLAGAALDLNALRGLGLAFSLAAFFPARAPGALLWADRCRGVDADIRLAGKQVRPVRRPLGAARDDLLGVAGCGS